MEKHIVRNARYLSDGSIDCELLLPEQNIYIPITVTSSCTSETGMVLWQKFKAGEYGDIKPYVITPEIINATREMKHAEISRWRNAQENGGVIFELDGHRWDGGKASQERLAPVVSVAKAGMLPEGFFWTDADNHDIPVNAAFLQQLEAAMMQAMVIQGFKIHERQRQMKYEVSQLTEVNAILNYQPGWTEEE
ncbi:DUF4376 domain-containing protein [Citrobacter sp. VF227]